MYETSELRNPRPIQPKRYLKTAKSVPLTIFFFSLNFHGFGLGPWVVMAVVGFHIHNFYTTFSKPIQPNRTLVNRVIGWLIAIDWLVEILGRFDVCLLDPRFPSPSAVCTHARTTVRCLLYTESNVLIYRYSYTRHSLHFACDFVVVAVVAFSRPMNDRFCSQDPTASGTTR